VNGSANVELETETGAHSSAECRIDFDRAVVEACSPEPRKEMAPQRGGRQWMINSSVAMRTGPALHSTV
jgi:hypothetical protein